MHLKKHNVLAQSLLLTTLFSVFDGCCLLSRAGVFQGSCHHEAKLSGL